MNEIQGTLQRITDEALQIKRLVITLDQAINPVPGQFVMVRFPDTEGRAFSIVEYDPAKKAITLCVKEEGLFTQRLCKGEDTTFLIKGPYGVFTLEEPYDAVFIAGGIGITPLYALLKALPEPHCADLFYIAKSAEAMALKQELSKLEGERIHIHRFTTKIPSEGCILGRCSRDHIKSIPKYQERSYYLCGPTSFMDDFTAQLHEVGIQPERIHREAF